MEQATMLLYIGYPGSNGGAIADIVTVLILLGLFIWLFIKARPFLLYVIAWIKYKVSNFFRKQH